MWWWSAWNKDGYNLPPEGRSLKISLQILTHDPDQYDDDADENLTVRIGLAPSDDGAAGDSVDQPGRW